MRKPFCTQASYQQLKTTYLAQIFSSELQLPLNFTLRLNDSFLGSFRATNHDSSKPFTLSRRCYRAVWKTHAQLHDYLSARASTFLLGASVRARLSSLEWYTTILAAILCWVIPQPADRKRTR